MMNEDSNAPAAPNPLRFVVPARVYEVPTELAQLPPDTTVIRFASVAGGTTDGPISAGDLADMMRETAKRQDEGWLELDEAAQLLEEAGRGDAKTWREKLKAAAQSSALPMHVPQSLERIVYEGRQPRPVRTSYEWAHVDDLNSWLDANEPRLPFRFDHVPTIPPKTEPPIAASSTPPPNRSEAPGPGGFVATLFIAPSETVWNTDEVPRLTANALSPVPDSEEDPVTALLRIDSKDGRDHYNPLPEADLDTLRAFWKGKGLPPPGTTMNTEQWMPYLLAWNDTSPKPEWQFAVLPARDPFHGARVMRCAIELTHKEQLQKALDAGTTVARMKGTMVEAPSWVASSSTVLTRSELTKFCESLCIRVQVSEAAGGSLPVEYLWSDSETFTLDEALLLLARPFEAAVRGEPFLLREPAEARKYTEMEGQICRALVASAERGTVALCDRKSGRRLDLPLPEDQDTTEVVVSRGDLQRFALAKLKLDLRPMESTAQAEQRRIEGYYTLSEVSKSIAEELQWTDGRRREFLKDMMEAGAAGRLRLRKPVTHGYYTSAPATVREHHDVVSPGDINEWLPLYGASFLWRVGVPVNAAESRLGEARPKAAANGLQTAKYPIERSPASNPGLPAIATKSPVSTQEPSPQAHRLSDRRDPLAAVIDMAREAAANADDYQSVWAALVKLARSPQRPAPLIGYVELEGVQYEVAQSEIPKYFTRDSLKKRFARAKAKARKAGAEAA